MKKAEQIYREYNKLGRQRGAMSELARKYGVSRQRIWNIVQKYDNKRISKREIKRKEMDKLWDERWGARFQKIMKGRKRIPPNDAEWLSLLYEMLYNGAEIRWIAQKTGRNENTISHFKKKLYG